MSQSPSKPFTPEQTVDGAMQFQAIINGLIGKSFTNTVVKVVAVDNGATGPVGFVDVVNLIMQEDENGDAFENTKLYRLPYFRLQGGANAVVIDPEVGDLGIAAFAMRDTTNVKNTKAEARPASRREYSCNDGFYYGGFLNGAPSQYIHFLGSGINIVATGEINIKGTKIVLDAPVEATKDVKAALEITDMTQLGNGQTMSSMRQIYNGHDHYENGQGSNTNKPNQQV